MEPHLITICTGVILVCIALIANALAYVLTEIWPIPIHVKPFTCYGCLSFWFTVVLGFTVAFTVSPQYQHPETQVVARYGIIVLTVFLGLINYLFVKSKYIVYE